MTKREKRPIAADRDMPRSGVFDLQIAAPVFYLAVPVVFSPVVGPGPLEEAPANDVSNRYLTQHFFFLFLFSLQMFDAPPPVPEKNAL